MLHPIVRRVNKCILNISIKVSVYFRNTTLVEFRSQECKVYCKYLPPIISEDPNNPCAVNRFLDPVYCTQ